VKHTELVHHLEAHGCQPISEVSDFLARKICRDLDITEP